MVSWLIVCFDPCCLTPSAGWRRTECLKHWWNVTCQANFLRTGWWMRGGYSSLQGEMRVKLLYMPQGAIAATLGVLRARRRDGFTNCVFLAIRRRLKRPSRLQQPPCDFSLHKCLPQHDFRSNLPARYPNPQAWLTDVLSRVADHKINRIDELLPWRYAASVA